MRAGLLQIAGIVEGPDIFSDGEAYWVNGKEMAYFAGEHVLEIRLTRPMIGAHRARLRDDPRVTRRARSSDWIAVRFERASDVRLALELAEISATAHRPRDGSPLKPPPEGARLERMRRWH